MSYMLCFLSILCGYTVNKPTVSQATTLLMARSLYPVNKSLSRVSLEGFAQASLLFVSSELQHIWLQLEI